MSYHLLFILAYNGREVANIVVNQTEYLAQLAAAKARGFRVVELDPILELKGRDAVELMVATIYVE